MADENVQSKPDDAILTVLKDWQACVEEVFNLEEQLKDAKERQRIFELTTLPSMFDEREWTGFTLKSGRRVELKEVLHVTLAKGAEARNEALQFLRDANAGGIIKRGLKLEGDDVETAASSLSEAGIAYELIEDVNTNTLKATVADLLGLRTGTTRFSIDELPKGLGAFLERRIELSKGAK